MTRGPAPTPTKVLALHGSWRAKARRGEPQPKVEAPEIPASLVDPVAIEEWQRVTAEMMAVGIAALLDHALVELHCVCYARWRRAEEEIAKSGAVVKSPNGFPMKNPWLAVSEAAAKTLTALSDRLGLSPSARTRISVTTQAGSIDAFSTFLANGVSRRNRGIPKRNRA